MRVPIFAAMLKAGDAPPLVVMVTVPPRFGVVPRALSRPDPVIVKLPASIEIVFEPMLSVPLRVTLRAPKSRSHIALVTLRAPASVQVVAPQQDAGRSENGQTGVADVQTAAAARHPTRRL